MPTIEGTIPCYEVATNVTEGEILRFRNSAPAEGFSYITIATKDEFLKGKIQSGKSYKVTVEEIE